MFQVVRWNLAAEWRCQRRSWGASASTATSAVMLWQRSSQPQTKWSLMPSTPASITPQAKVQMPMANFHSHVTTALATLFPFNVSWRFLQSETLKWSDCPYWLFPWWLQGRLLHLSIYLARWKQPRDWGKELTAGLHRAHVWPKKAELLIWYNVQVTWCGLPKS
jgi:hypothetical protein